jgi:hypothetical protein
MIIPIFRMFDEAKAREFYVEWLGFQIDFEHRFDPNAPLYMGLSLTRPALSESTLGPIRLHLSEHHGDAAPGGNAFVEFAGLEEYHSELIVKQYKYNRPGLQIAPWDEKMLTMTVNDPFFNRLSFTERIKG